MRELLRANRAFALGMLRYDVPLVVAGWLHAAGSRGRGDVTVQGGVFAALVVILLAVFEAQVVRRAAPGLRNMLVLPLRREKLLAAFFVAFALPGTLAIALGGLLAATGIAIAGPAGAAGTSPSAVPGVLARTLQAGLAFLCMKSLVLNVLVVLRQHFVLLLPWLAVLTAIILALTGLREVAGDVVTPIVFTALFVGVCFGWMFAAVRDLDL